MRDYDGVLFFKGTLTEQDLLPRADSIARFAIAMNHHFGGDNSLAETMLREIIESAAQGFWPAESELIAMGR